MSFVVLNCPFTTGGQQISFKSGRDLNRMKNHTQLTGNLQKSFQEEGAGKHTGKTAFSTMSRRPGWLEHSDSRQT